MSRKARTVCTAVHRYLGLATMVFLAIAALTGCLLCYDRAIDAALNPDLFGSTAVGAPASPATLADRIDGERRGRVTGFPLRTHARHTIEMYVAPARTHEALAYDQLFVDPIDGHVVGARKSGAGWGRRHFTDSVFALHYTLLAGTWGRWLMGVCALGWLTGNLVGLYLTFPFGRPFWQRWRRSWRIEWRGRLRWRLLDLHRASGLWLLAPLCVLAFTSLAMNFFDEAFTPIVSTLSPAKPSPFDGPMPTVDALQPRIGFAAALDRGLGLAHDTSLRWLPSRASYAPERNLYGIAFTPDGADIYRELGPVTFWLDGTTGRLAYTDDPYHDSSGRKVSRALYPLHSGQVIGWPGVLLVCLLGIVTTGQCGTGAYIWWTKRRSRRAIRSASSPSR